MSKRILAVSARRDQQLTWERSFAEKNVESISRHNEARGETTLANGDVIYWRVLGEGLYGVRCDDLWEDPAMCVASLSDQQFAVLTMLPTRVRPK